MVMSAPGGSDIVGRGRRSVVGTWLALPLFLVFSMLAATSGVLWGVDEWYFRINRPSWTPPGWLFGPVWTTLYVMIGVSAWRVWRVGGFRRDRIALGLFLVQWVLNFAWTGLFFGLRRPDIALAEIIVLLAFIAATAWRFRRHDLTACLLLVPYFLWVSFATVLNGAFWWLNRG
jgi:tryptophan-rich sensory protein